MLSSGVATYVGCSDSVMADNEAGKAAAFARSSVQHAWLLIVSTALK